MFVCKSLLICLLLHQVQYIVEILFFEDFKYNKIKNIFCLNMQISPSTIGAELSSQLKYPYLKDHYRFYFYQFFLEMVAR